MIFLAKTNENERCRISESPLLSQHPAAYDLLSIRIVRSLRHLAFPVILFFYVEAVCRLPGE